MENLFETNKVYHVTCVTHNSRVSLRMIRFNVKVGDPIQLNEHDEIQITRSIRNIVINDNLIILAYNICRDHIHFIIVCTEDHLIRIVQKIKSVSSKLYNRTKKHPERTGEVPPLFKHKPLWAQKFNRQMINTHDQLVNSIIYVNNNRVKHDLLENAELKSIIKEFVTSYEKLIEKMNTTTN